MPKLWAYANGVNHYISERTAAFIVEQALFWKADVIVLEHLNLTGRKKRGSKR